MKKRWGLESTRRFWVIMLVFALTGSGILLVKRPVFNVLGLTDETAMWIKIPLIILFYQTLLLMVGAIFGEFHFFWEKEKRLFRLLARPFGFRQNQSSP